MLLKSLNNIDLVLASGAKWRSDILLQLGLQHRRVSHRYNEPPYKNGPLTAFIRDVAIEKARSIQRDFENSIIISADQLVTLDGEIFYKSENREEAIEQLLRLSGKTHELICAICVTDGEKTEARLDKALLKMRALSKREIKAYVELDTPWGCAGSYKIESLGASLFEEVNTSDLTTIIGLPGSLLIDILREWGFSNLL
jgi:septum formation protein